MRWRRIIAVVAIAALAAAVAVVLGRGPTSETAKNVKGLMRLEGGLDENEGGAAAEAYADRAFPADTVSIGQVQGAISANASVNARGAKLGSNRAGFWPSPAVST